MRRAVRSSSRRASQTRRHGRACRSAARGSAAASRRLRIPHAVIEAERVRQHQRRTAFRAVVAVVEPRAVGLDERHHDPSLRWSRGFGEQCAPQRFRLPEIRAPARSSLPRSWPSPRSRARASPAARRERTVRLLAPPHAPRSTSRRRAGRPDVRSERDDRRSAKIDARRVASRFARILDDRRSAPRWQPPPRQPPRRWSARSTRSLAIPPASRRPRARAPAPCR